MRLTSFWEIWGFLFLAQEDVEQETCEHQYQGSYLNSIIVIPAKEETADEQDGTKNDYDGSQILLEVVNCLCCFICLFFYWVQNKWFLSEK